jgi:hypothetical protein
MTQQTYPRSPQALFGGIAHLGRFIDKIRGDLRGHTGFLATGTESLSAEIQNVHISSPQEPLISR